MGITYAVEENIYRLKRKALITCGIKLLQSIG